MTTHNDPFDPLGLLASAAGTAPTYPHPLGNPWHSRWIATRHRTAERLRAGSVEGVICGLLVPAHRDHDDPLVEIRTAGGGRVQVDPRLVAIEVVGLEHRVPAGAREV